MQLKLLLSKASTRQIRGSVEVDISSLCYDSRQAQPGSLFFAVRGSQSDGHDHVADAIRRGAVAFVAERPVHDQFDEVTFIEVDEVRASLASLSAFFYHQPALKLKLAGITGTNGKTTTSYLLKHICERVVWRSGLIGTVRYESRMKCYRVHAPLRNLLIYNSACSYAGRRL